MNAIERAELTLLEAADRAGQCLTGTERGRLADLRRAEILATIAGRRPTAAGLPPEIEYRGKPTKGTP